MRTRLGYPFRFVELAQEINATMPAYVVQRAQNLLNEDSKALRGSTVLLRGDVQARHRRPARVPRGAAAQQLIAKGAKVQFHDDKVESWHAVPDAEKVDDGEAAVAAADLAILVQNHKTYDLDAIAAAAQRMLDTRGVASGERVRRL
ncbi:hypothetical protein GCM10022199_13870 [Marihabitans asiaticum]